MILFIPEIPKVLANQRLASGDKNTAELFSARSENTAPDITKVFFQRLIKVDKVIKNIL